MIRAPETKCVSGVGKGWSRPGKVAVESRQGELFYRVQVVGINSEAEGEATLKALAQLDDMPNLQLRRY